jgi:long-chain acyl-CoA synthetase
MTLQRDVGRWPQDGLSVRREARYGDRVVDCFADRPRSLHGLLAAAVARNGAGEALVDGGLRYSWQDLQGLSARLATGLATRGVKRGDRIILFIGNRSEFIIALFAVTRLGAVFVPVSTRAARPELAYMANNCGAVGVIHDAELADRVPDAGEVPSLKLRIATAASPGSELFEAVLADAAEAPVAEVDEEDTAVILYTSGTTGNPKGAMQTHLNLVHGAMVYVHCLGMTGRDRSIVCVPMSHTTGLTALIGTMTCCAGTMIIMPAFHARDFLDLAERERMTHTVLVPAMYNLCLLQADFASRDLSAWRVGAFGGAPMPAATISRLAERLPGLGLMNVYGATETAAGVTVMPAAETAAHRDSVGRIVPCADIRIMDAEGREVPAGETGELWIAGPTVVRGYWNNAAATAENFTGGYWHSGDLGSIDAHGFVRVFDRKKDMINRGGYKIYTAEVENALSEHLGVVESAVVGKPCPVLGERVHAFVTLRDTALDAEALKAFCAERLSDYKVPETFTLLEAPLPRNANGKVMKRQLRERTDA